MAKHIYNSMGAYQLAKKQQCDNKIITQILKLCHVKKQIDKLYTKLGHSNVRKM